MACTARFSIYMKNTYADSPTPWDQYNVVYVFTVVFGKSTSFSAPSGGSNHIGRKRLKLLRL